MKPSEDGQLLQAGHAALDACDFGAAQSAYLRASQVCAAGGRADDAEVAHALYLFARAQLLGTDPTTVQEAKETSDRAAVLATKRGMGDLAKLCQAMALVCEGMESEGDGDHEEAGEKYEEAGELLQAMSLTQSPAMAFVLNQKKYVDMLARVAYFRDMLTDENFEAAKTMKAEAAASIRDFMSVVTAQVARDWYAGQIETMDVDLGLHRTIFELVQWRPEAAKEHAEMALPAAERAASLVSGKSFPLKTWSTVAVVFPALPEMLRGLVRECDAKLAWLAGDWPKAEANLQQAVVEYRAVRSKTQDAGYVGLNLQGTVNPRITECEGLLDRLKEQRAPEFGLIPNFSKLATDDVALQSLRGDWEECGRCFRSGSWKATLVMVGALLEKLLYMKACQNDSAIRATRIARERRAGKDGFLFEMPFGRWTLQVFIDAALELRWISTGVDRFSHAVREHRNLVHAEKDLDARAIAGRQEAAAAVYALQMAMRDLGLLNGQPDKSMEGGA